MIDLGTYKPDPPDDYPDFAEKVGLALKRGDAPRGILICGSGVGVCVAANKIPGIRAGMCHDTYSAHQGVEHDDMNVIVLGARIIGSALAFEVVNAFIGASSLLLKSGLCGGTRRCSPSRPSISAGTGRRTQHKVRTVSREKRLTAFLRVNEWLRPVQRGFVDLDSCAGQIKPFVSSGTRQ